MMCPNSLIFSFSKIRFFKFFTLISVWKNVIPGMDRCNEPTEEGGACIVWNRSTKLLDAK